MARIENIKRVLANIIITSAKEVMFYPSVFLSLFLFACLLATLHKTTDRIFMKILPEMYLQRRKNLLNFGRHPLLDPDLGSFKGFFNIA